MKVFKVWVDSCSYDEYDGAVVVAESEEDVRSHFVHGVYTYSKTGYSRFKIDDYYNDEFEFADGQGEIHIEEVPTDKFAVILTSFNAG